jgi:hypothetical protein
MPTTVRKRLIWVTFRLEGFHRWADAPLTEEYLRSNHRHLFHSKVTIPVDHAEREIEFHRFLSDVKTKAEWMLSEQTDSSCEGIAHCLAEWITNQYERSAEVEVSEDGECGAIVRLVV